MIENLYTTHEKIRNHSTKKDTNYVIERLK